MTGLADAEREPGQITACVMPAATKPAIIVCDQRKLSVPASVILLRARGLSSVPSTLRDEKATNPFLRCAEPAVIAAGLAHAAVDPEKVAIFAAIRGWRNSF